MKILNPTKLPSYNEVLARYRRIAVCGANMSHNGCGTKVEFSLTDLFSIPVQSQDHQDIKIFCWRCPICNANNPIPRAQLPDGPILVGVPSQRDYLIRLRNQLLVEHTKLCGQAKTEEMKIEFNID